MVYFQTKEISTHICIHAERKGEGGSVRRGERGREQEKGREKERAREERPCVKSEQPDMLTEKSEVLVRIN